MDARIEMALSWLTDNIDKKFALKKLSGMTGMSSSHFQHLLKLETGRNLRQHVGAMRLRKAKVLLLDFSLGLKQVAFLVGYSSETSLSRAFKTGCGVTPRSFRLGIVSSHEKAGKVAADTVSNTVMRV